MVTVLSPPLDRKLRDRVKETIALYDVHATLPVPIRQLARDAGWDVRFRERMGHILAWATHEDNLPVMGINASISTIYQRYAMGHEIGHELAGHLSSGDTRTLTSILRPHDIDEAVADASAALLLVPAYALDDFDTVHAVARACEVPRRLVELRLSLDS